jgi:hypothetical protein
VANEDHLVKAAKVHGTPKHAHILLAVCGMESSHSLVPEKSRLTNTLTLPHVVDGDAQVKGFVGDLSLQRPAQTLRPLEESPTELLRQLLDLFQPVVQVVG